MSCCGYDVNPKSNFTRMQPCVVVDYFISDASSYQIFDLNNAPMPPKSQFYLSYFRSIISNNSLISLLHDSSWMRCISNQWLIDTSQNFLSCCQKVSKGSSGIHIFQKQREVASWVGSLVDQRLEPWHFNQSQVRGRQLIM